MAMKTAAAYAAEGCVIKPLVQTFLQSPKMDFDFRLKAEWIRQREWDGWFHSSSHPGLSDEELIDYLEKRTKPWEITYNGAMGTIFGVLVHVVVQAAMDYFNVSVPLPPGPCIACGQPRTGKNACREHGVRDERLHSRGHMDNIVTVGPGGMNILDIKTIKPFGAYGLKDAPDMDPEYFRGTWPKYFAQGQDYMRMTGIRNFICFFMSMGNPWEMREYHIPFDPMFAYQIERKYMRALARSAVEL
jgi:hypothetical protein